MASAIDVTVRLPFSGDRTLRVTLDTTVSALIRRVLRLVPELQRQGSSQCMMYRGRVLEDERTFAQLEIPNNAVLQIMPRPHRVVHRFRGADSSTFDPIWEQQEDLEHDHEHVHGHLHANVLISHVGFNNRRAQYSDIREMLVSLFQALGFSTNSINNTADVAAALLISFDSGVEREQPSRSVLEAAWSVVRTLQQQMSTAVTNSVSNPSQTQAITEGDANPSSTLSTPSINGHTQTNPTWNSSRSAMSRTRTSPQSRTSEGPESSSGMHQEGSAARASQVHDDDRLPTISMLPEHPPAHDRSISDRHAAARAADRLVPALGELLSNLAHRLRDAPSFTSVIEGERAQDMSRLTELAGATAGAMTAVATLMSGTLPGENGEDDERDRHPSSRRSNSSQRRRQSRTRSGSANQEGQSAPHAQNGSDSTPNTTGESGSSRRPGEGNRTNAPRNRSARRGNAPWLVVSQSHSDDEEEEGNYDTYQEMNAGFLVRFMAYYYYSFAGADSADEHCPDYNGGTAVDVLRDSFGSDGCEEPLNPFLRVLYYVMDMLTPLEFHKVCRGDFSPIADCRYEVWEIIKDEFSEVADDFVAPNDFEDYFVYFICEKLHTFVHMFDAHNRDNEGRNVHHDDDEDDFCRHTMHYIHRVTLRLLDILTGEMEDVEFATKLQEWFLNSFAGVVHVLGEQTEQDWDSVILAFRQACNEVGVSVLGGQYSVVFPLILNLFLGRARAAYDRINSESNARRGIDGITHDDEQDSATEEEGFDHSHCGPDCPSRQELEEDEFDHSLCGPHCPRREVQESETNRRSTSNSSSENHGVDSDEDLPDLVSDSDDSADDSTENSTSTDDETFANLRNRTNRQNTNNSTYERVSSSTVRGRMEIDNDVGLDDQDFDDIVAELNREIVPGAGNPTHAAEDSDAEFMELATELEKEAVAGPSGTSHTNEGSQQGNVSKEKLSASGRVSSAAFPTTSLRRGPHVGSNLPTGRSSFVGSSTMGHPSFSSTAVPVARSANYSRSSIAQSSDEFDVLGRVAGKRWRSIVRGDEQRLSAATQSALSRGYRYDVEPQRPLNEDTALKIVEEGLEAAAKEVPVTASEGKELQRILREGSAECLEYVESAIQSRVIDEDDFDTNTYPSATSRFLGWADMPE
ncbi:Ubiquitin [Gracilaria domingensis]|nr:Ubiquitin [Gracilaria domingensis]